MSQKIKDVGQIPVSASVLGDLIGVGDRRIRQLAEEGVILRISKGRYDLAQSVKNFIKYLRVQEGLTETPRNEQEQMEHEKMLHERAKREIAELKLAAMRGEMHRAEDIEKVMTDQYSAFRSKLLNIPSKVAAPVAIITEKSQAKALVEAEILEALEELAEYNPEDFYSEEYIETDELEDDDGTTKRKEADHQEKDA